MFHNFYLNFIIQVIYPRLIQSIIEKPRDVAAKISIHLTFNTMGQRLLDQPIYISFNIVECIVIKPKGCISI